MKRIHAVALAGVAALALSLGAISTAPTFAAETTKMVGGAAMYPSKNIVQNAVNSKDHTTLIAAVKAAGLVPTLESSGPFTVFAPRLLPSSQRAPSIRCSSRRTRPSSPAFSPTTWSPAE